MRARLTKRVVDAAEPGKWDRYVWDVSLPGFGLRVRPAGTKLYVFRYSSGRRGVTRWISIGEHGDPWTAETARVEAEKLRGAVARGEDPAAAREAAKDVPTLAEFGARFLSEHVAAHNRASTAAEYRRQVERIIGPRLGPLRLDKVSGADVARLLHQRRDSPIDANRTRAVLSRMFTLAERWGLRPSGSNPCRGLERYRETRRERFLSEAELARLGRALDEADSGRVCGLSFADEDKARAEGKLPERLPTSPVDPFAVVAVRLLLFTGARRSEILTAKWDDVDLSAGTLRVPAPKEGQPKRLRLSAPALAVLAGLSRVAGNPYVIAGRKPGAHLDDVEKPWQRIRKRAGLEDVRLHDLRHSYASVAVAGGASLPVIGALLGHRQPATTARYAHLSDDPLRAVADTVGEQIAAALRRGTEAPAGNVVPIERHRA